MTTQEASVQEIQLLVQELSDQTIIADREIFRTQINDILNTSQGQQRDYTTIIAEFAAFMLINEQHGLLRFIDPKKDGIGSERDAASIMLIAQIYMRMSHGEYITEASWEDAYEETRTHSDTCYDLCYNATFNRLWENTYCSTSMAIQRHVLNLVMTYVSRKSLKDKEAEDLYYTIVNEQKQKLLQLLQTQ